MSRLQRWIYRDLIDVYYDTESPLSLDLEKVCNDVGAFSDEECKIVESLLKYKFERMEDGYHHIRCDGEISDYHIKAETARTNGKAGGRPRKQIESNNKPIENQSGFNQDAISNQFETGSKTNHKPITKNHKPLTNKEHTPDGELFENVSEQIIKDFKAHRTAHRAKITKTAIDGIKREALKAGVSLEDALRICIERNWRGFKADWILQQATGSPGSYESPRDKSRRETIEGLTGSKKNDETTNFIDLN